MADLVVITGGSSGMGLEAARIIGKRSDIIIIGRSVKKLETARQDLKASGVDAEIYQCDVKDKASVEALAKHAASKGSVKAVIHSAGLSPDNATTEEIIAVNVLGTIYVNLTFAPVMAKKSCILDVASMAGHFMSEDKMPMDLFPLSFTDPIGFEQKLAEINSKLPKEQQSGIGYSMAKFFNIWFAKECAIRYSPDIRVVSVSPGSFNTPMGRAGGERTASYAKSGPLRRLGEPEEIAKLFAFLISDDASYITAADYLCDGGCVAASKHKAAAKNT